MVRSIWLSVALLFLSSFPARTQSGDRPLLKGHITGTVIDADGNPAPEVLVAASERLVASTVDDERGPSGVQDRREHKGPKQYSKWLEETVVWPVELHEGLTNSYGEFEIEGLELGTYALSGEREDWYPAAQLTVIDGSPADVTLTGDNPSARVILRLGSKGGVVSGSVKDKTGNAIEATFAIFWVDDNHQWLSASARSDFRFLIPSARDVSLRVSADGYKTASVPLRFEPGQHKVLNLELEPKENAPTVLP